MKVNGTHYRTVWRAETGAPVVRIIDQRKLPFQFEIEDLVTVAQAADAIRDMHVRGAGCIGAAAGYAMWLAAVEAAAAPDRFDDVLHARAEQLAATRPTAVNLRWAIDRQLRVIRKENAPDEAVAVAAREADAIADEDAASCEAIGSFGLPIIETIAARKPAGEPVRILTHCNAGWLAFVDFGSATAPIYAAHRQGIPVHVWVDETRPRSQGARLTAWELAGEGVPHAVIADNAGGHLMQRGMVDLVVTGTDRTARSGDVANKIGTYLKALAARDCGIPFYVALPSSTFDWEISDGLRDIPIEERDPSEITRVEGRAPDGRIIEVEVVSPGSPAANPAFDVTPARLVTGLITERGACPASEEGIATLFPDHLAPAAR